MLIQFRFKNFKSFRDDTILDLSATKITENSNHVIHIGTEKILPIAAIYGANASGKSNVVDAFRFMAIYVLDSFAYGGEGDEEHVCKMQENHHCRAYRHHPLRLKRGEQRKAGGPGPGAVPGLYRPA